MGFGVQKLKRHTKKPYTSHQYDDKLTSDPQAAALAEVVWLGDSRDVLRAFPTGHSKISVMRCIGFSLDKRLRTASPCERLAPGSTNCGSRTSAHGTESFT